MNLPEILALEGRNDIRQETFMKHSSLQWMFTNFTLPINGLFQKPFVRRAAVSAEEVNFASKDDLLDLGLSLAWKQQACVVVCVCVCGEGGR